MEKKLRVLFDGEALHPEEPVDLEPNAHYIVTIEKEHLREQPSNRALQNILKRATDLGISDLADQHNHYLYGTDKR